ncbi:polyphosphate polymerase domain-containing protein [Eggerthellaceae bacterium 24-137]
MAYDSVFKRVEKKYRIASCQRAAVEAAARGVGAMAVDAYGRSRITSLYLDTPGRAMIARSVEKPLYKEKLRLRAYGEASGAALMEAFAAGPLLREAVGAPLSDAEVTRRAQVGWEAALAIAGREAAGGGGILTPGGEAGGGGSASAPASAPADPCAISVFFGIKKKFKGIVYKRRVALSLPAALAFVSGLPYERACVRWPLADTDQAAAALAPASRQIARELQAAMDRWLPIAPSMGIACDREAWATCCALAGADASMPALPAGGAPTSVPASFDPDLRLTFDDRLEYLDCRAHASAWRPIIAPSESILEIKSAGPYPSWLVTALSSSEVYPASFTKYGNAYQLCEGSALQRAVAVS